MRLIDFFRRGLLSAPDRIAFVDADGNGACTYAQVDTLAEKIAAGLHAVSDGDANVAIYSPNDPRAFCAMIGIFRAGRRWVPINMRNPVAINAAFLRTTKCTVLFFHPSLEGQVRELRDTVPTLQHLVCIEQSQEDSIGMSFDRFIAQAKVPAPEPLDESGRIETVFPTGGTTGLSKAAMWTQRTWESAIKAFWACLPTDRPAVHLVAAPMTHGAGVVALMMMAEGATNVVLPSADALSILDAIQRHKVTHFYIPPTVLYNLLAHPRVHEFDYSSLRSIVLAAAPVAPAKLKEAMEVFGPVVCQSFGQAEAPMFLTFLATRDITDAPEGSDRWASCGRATLGQRVEIMGDDGVILAPGERGEIVARGDLVFGGYYENPAASEEVSMFGWHHTGDVGYKDNHGFVYIVDRKKDMIVTGGFNVFSAEVEHVIAEHPSVEDCAVIGVPDEKWGEAVKAVIQLKPSTHATEQEIVQLVKSVLGSVHAPKTVDIVTSLPRSPNGKVLKREIRDKFWAGANRRVG
ncbi:MULTISPECIES: AMP-binding protein [Comamonadaceae]|uniref:class I adenylate-forming enzyme family protein n=1 Tax=Comamonadaceae TaxID=80864 RepID=UPI0010F443F2|nr:MULTISPECIES: AMP-binding protein [Comamonadaceae]